MSYSWNDLISEEKTKSYFKDLEIFLSNERETETIYPAKENVLRAFDLTPFDKVKVVILGQDPYHGEGQAHGLSFSVLPDMKFPPSLVNIFKELEDDLGIKRPNSGCLEGWAREGVLLLNTVLTVRKGEAASHQGRGWEVFTDRVIEELSKRRKGIIFILWGAPSQKKASKVNLEEHFIIQSPHPSPLSSYRGFFGSKPFSKTNAYLLKIGQKEINWKL